MATERYPFKFERNQITIQGGYYTKESNIEVRKHVPAVPRVVVDFEDELARHSPACTRYLFSACLLVNIGLFVFANTHAGATVHVLLTVGGERVLVCLNYASTDPDAREGQLDTMRRQTPHFFKLLDR